MDSVQEYIDSIAPGHRSLFDRVSGLILEDFPQRKGHHSAAVHGHGGRHRR
ncbi:hypothetical protein [Streptomyces sp. NPDC001135]